MPKSFVPETEEGLNEFLDKIEAEARPAFEARNKAYEKAIRLYNDGVTEKPKNDTAHFRANIIAPSVHRKGSLLVEMKPRLDVRPRRNGLYETSKLIRRAIEAGWDEHGMQMALEELCMLYLQVLSSGFMEIGFDPNANFGRGSIAFSSVDPRQVIVDRAIVRSKDLDLGQYMRVRTIAPLHVFQSLYPGSADKLRSTKKIIATESDSKSGGALQRGVRRIFGQPDADTDAPIPRVEVDAYWFRDPAVDEDSDPLYPGGRCVVRASGDVICLTEPFSAETLREETRNPYYDGLWPYEWLDNMPQLDSAWGRDEVAAARWIQNTFDKVGDSTIDTMLVNSRPMIMAPKNTLDQSTVGTLRRMRHIVLEYAAGRGDVRREPSPVPTGAYLQLMDMCQSILEYTQGLQDAGGGIPARGRAEVRSLGMLEGLQNAAQVLVRAQARRLEAFLERVGQKWISRIFQFMNSDQLMWYAGGPGVELQQYEFERQKLTEEIFSIALKKAQEEHERKQEKERQQREDEAVNLGIPIPLINPTPPPEVLGADEQLAAVKGAWREFSFRIVPGSSLATTRAQQVQVLTGMKAQGIPIPDSMVMEEIGYSNSEEITKKAREEMMVKQALGLPVMPQGNRKPGRR